MHKNHFVQERMQYKLPQRNILEIISEGFFIFIFLFFRKRKGCSKINISVTSNNFFPCISIKVCFFFFFKKKKIVEIWILREMSLFPRDFCLFPTAHTHQKKICMSFLKLVEVIGFSMESPRTGLEKKIKSCFAAI